MVVHIPMKLGARGYGAKVSGNEILIPYNHAVIEAYPDITTHRITTMIRSRFNELPMLED